jgi:3-hydroxybutyryl-CoA dehydrogenase
VTFIGNKLGIVGAGQMGAGIAQTAARSGIVVCLADLDKPAAERGKQVIATQLKRITERGKMTPDEAAALLDNIHPVGSLDELSDCHTVIEAVSEQIDLKRGILQKLDSILPGDAIIASNTSSLSITRLAATTNRPEKVIGMHFMNPVPVMTLVEIIKGLRTDEATYLSIVSLAQNLGKTTVLGIDSAGFIVNRILMPMINEAIFLLQEGVAAADIDTAMKLGTNQPMGPLTLADFIGLDTVLFILQVLHRDLGEDKYRPCPLLNRYVEAGLFGKKVGQGFYTYTT